ncbi:hypothetical protein ThrDRAFT_03652 [Frankia casuarinae]|nr:MULTISPECIES: hypothetical protein [Frankia]ETA00898.1 hypothetical protein CcI6DRAFT_03660 [Frankia sp. CcI6]EYT90716.1 hypothetical protein ThrDRAFT_03652 [Frankia casuarinae]KDA41465.1 hypothetical protein BMG523Draft_03724 [Frankia sp. BMG5.23]KEZ35007.1 hypothetical protein CEDDRAFT_03620 [Frankia sp. CeD]KFB02988.1 hypothetical protein ALLO2DRAFT_04259 [Frankia sp. Allo2]
MAVPPRPTDRERALFGELAATWTFDPRNSDLRNSDPRKSDPSKGSRR